MAGVAMGALMPNSEFGEAGDINRRLAHDESLRSRDQASWRDGNQSVVRRISANTRKLETDSATRRRRPIFARASSVTPQNRSAA